MQNVQSSLDNVAQLLHKALPVPTTRHEAHLPFSPERATSVAADRRVPLNTGPITSPAQIAQPIVSLAQWVSQVAGPETPIPPAEATIHPETASTHVLPNSPTTSFGLIRDTGSGSQAGPRASTIPFITGRSPVAETRVATKGSYCDPPKRIEPQSRDTLVEDAGEEEIEEEGMSTIRDMLRDEETARLRADGHDRTGHIERDVFRGDPKRKGLGKSRGHDQMVIQRGHMQGNVMDAVDIGLCGEIEGRELFDLYVASVRYLSPRDVNHDPLLPSICICVRDKIEAFTVSSRALIHSCQCTTRWMIHGKGWCLMSDKHPTIPLMFPSARRELIWNQSPQPCPFLHHRHSLCWQKDPGCRKAHEREAARVAGVCGKHRYVAQLMSPSNQMFLTCGICWTSL